MKDSLVICNKCGSDACYEQYLGENYKIQLCYGCGFTTNSLMTTSSEFLQEQLETLPELYKDLVFKDSNEQYWMPSYTKIEDKGMIFANGKDTLNWKWTSVKSTPIPLEEMDKFPEGTTHKMDMKTAQHYDERDYMEALDYIGVFNSKK